MYIQYVGFAKGSNSELNQVEEEETNHFYVEFNQ